VAHRNRESLSDGAQRSTHLDFLWAVETFISLRFCEVSFKIRPFNRKHIFCVALRSLRAEDCTDIMLTILKPVTTLYICLIKPDFLSESMGMYGACEPLSK
jgi:hypothetical protein